MRNRCAAGLVFLFLAFLALSLPARAGGEPRAQDDAAGAQAEGWPVSLDGQVLYRVRNSLGPLSPQERAERAERNIARIARDPFYSADLFQIEEREDAIVVAYRDIQIGAMTPKDAADFGEPALEVLERTIRTVKDAIEAYRERQRPRAWLRGSAIVLGAGLVLALVVLHVLRRSRRLQQTLRERGGASSTWLFKHRRNLSAERLLELELRLVRWGRNALLLVATLVFLELSFLALPITRAWATSILQYLIDPLRKLRDSFLLHVGDLFFILVIVLLVRWLLRVLRWAAVEAQEGSISLPMVTSSTALPAYKVVRMVVLAVACMVIYPYIPGSSTAAFKGIGLFAGALFTLGASSAAASLIVGVTLIFTDVFRVGDRIQVGDVMGDVVEVTLFLTRLRTPKNEIVTLSNGGILSSKLVNYSKEARGPGLILHTSVTIGYDAPWRRVHELLLQAAKATQGVMDSPEPFVLQSSLDDFYVSYELNAYTREANSLLAMYSALHQNIQDAFHQGGVEIMSPHFAALRDGSAAAIPPAPHGKPPGAPRPFGVRVEPGSGA